MPLEGELSGYAITRITEDGNRRVLENLTDVRVIQLPNAGVGSSVFEGTLIPFSSTISAYDNSTWKTPTVSAYYNGSWVTPTKGYRHNGTRWIRIL